MSLTGSCFSSDSAPRPLYGAFFVKEFARAAHLFPSSVSCRDDDQRGARFRARFNRATTLYPIGPRTRTMMQSCASAAKLRSGGPILPFGCKPRGVSGFRHLEPSSASCHKRTDKAETVVVPSASSVHCAGRKTTPSGTTPSRTSRHRAISSLRAKATIMGFRVPRAFSVRDRNHFVKALFFWCRRNRHAN